MAEKVYPKIGGDISDRFGIFIAPVVPVSGHD
jgi:hypothetical protein